MASHFFFNPRLAQCLAHWCGAGQPPEALLYLRNGPSFLRLGHRGGQREQRLAPHWQGMLSARGGLRLLEGAARAWPVIPSTLVKLQYFIDQACVPETLCGRGEPFGVLAVPPGPWLRHNALEQWYLGQAMQGHADYRAFASALRVHEGYQLVGFLNRHAAQACTLRALAERYGVSVSHFRRLCHSALGGRSKRELRDWRAATALLTLAEGPASLTEVALNCGYASSSHFARDIRQLLGVMPSSLVDITRLAQP